MFSVEILNSKGDKAPSQETTETGRYVFLKHLDVYKIQLSNNVGRKVDVEVSIDGASIGGFRLEAYRTITIERPVSEAKSFTFVQDTSGEAKEGGVTSGVRTNGLIEVVFKPELARKMERKSESSSGISEQVYNQLLCGMHNRTLSRCYDAKPIDRSSIKEEEDGDEDDASMSNSLFGVSAAPVRSMSNVRAGATVLGGFNSQTFRTIQQIEKYDTEAQETHKLRLVCYKQGYTALHPKRSVTPPPVPSS